MMIDPRVRRIVEEALESDATPEDLCRETPELLPEVRAGLARVRSLELELDAVFPDSAPRDRRQESRPFRCAQGSRAERDDSAAATADSELPHIHGHEIVEVIGRGGMGVVYRANDLCLRRVVAVKTLLSGVPKGPRELERFLREAQAAAGLTHPNIVQVHEVGNRDGVPYFTMEYVDGGSLAEWLEAAPRSAMECAALVATLADAVEFAHRGGIVHRDLKPSNVLLTADGIPKIVDFGVAFRLDCDPGLTATQSPVGTPSYMAPEQARSETGAIGPRSDVYALGAILYQALTGRPPFRAETSVETLRQVLHDEPVAPSSFDPRLRRDLETICLKCLEKDPDRRYGSAAELAAELRRFLRNEPIRARPAGRIERLYKWSRRHPARAALVSAVIVVVAAGMGAASWLKWRTTALEQAVQVDLERASDLGTRGDWNGARAALDRATARLDTFGCSELRSSVQRVTQELDLVARLDAIRVNRSTLPGSDQEFRASWERADREYERAFRDAGIGGPGDELATFAARVEGSTVRDAVIRSLDDWAVCVDGDDARREWLLAAARLADPDPTGWRDRVRNAATWLDESVLTELTRTAPESGASTPLLLALADRLARSGGDPAPFLAQLQQRHPDDYFVNQQLGVVLGSRGDEEGVRYLQASLALRPDSPIAWIHLGVALGQSGRLDESIRHLERALVMRPDSALAFANLGNAYTSARRFDDAIEAFDAALRIEPAGVSSRHNYGRMLLEIGRVDDAIAALTEAVELDPGYVEGRSALGHALHQANRPHEAIEQLRAAVALDPNHPGANNNLARSLAAIGREEEAIEYYFRAAELAPHDAVIRANLGNQLLRVDRDLEARTQLEIAVESDPTLAKAHQGLGIVLGELGEYRAAIEAFETARALAPDLAAVAAAIAYAQYMQGDFVAARDTAADYLASVAGNDPHRERVNVLLERARRLIEVGEKYEKVRSGEASVADAHEALDLAEFCRRRGDSLVAAEFAARALLEEPGLGADLRGAIRLDAARDALVAGSERSSPLPPEVRAEWRARARAWLRADLLDFDRVLAARDPREAETALRLARRMAVDPALDTLRGDGARLLPSAEREDCDALWREVAAFVERAQPVVAAISDTRRR